ncbi:YncE family protein [Streptomyces triticiradicis]|uniref:Uncharacterized protein n=1 Tax=Streptomyces triticiradicis TaxID=2651189 RepID=A0A7J5D9U2_9ACTN|nr:hypothetical protein [Streptomyces triticiradicis]KAB1984193.1 hypothetical protein F8144_28520 [Streptomyces triticiradicis]
MASSSSRTPVHIDLDTGSSTRSHFGRAPCGLALSPDGARVHLTLALEDSALVTDHFAMENFTEIHGITFPTGVAVTPDESFLCATNYFADSVTVIEL